uniref:Uncharacterized protein n=1 Tax=Sphaerodactylus townsendi TaxID=933632 RepID=A0ACB8EN78_9SAUR
MMVRGPSNFMISVIRAGLLKVDRLFELKQLAAHQSISVNSLFVNFSTDEVRLRSFAGPGRVPSGVISHLKMVKSFLGAVLVQSAGHFGMKRRSFRRYAVFVLEGDSGSYAVPGIAVGTQPTDSGSSRRIPVEDAAAPLFTKQLVLHLIYVIMDFDASKTLTAHGIVRLRINSSLRGRGISPGFADYRSRAGAVATPHKTPDTRLRANNSSHAGSELTNELGPSAGAVVFLAVTAL